MAMLKSFLFGCFCCRPVRARSAEHEHYDLLPEDGVQVKIAVKRLHYGLFKDVKEFCKQAQFLARLHHRNLLEVYGYCAEGRERLLVFKYMTNSSLDAHLRGHMDTQAGRLDWRKRMAIAKGCAEGLAYLHHSDLVHGGLKSSNVLLSPDFEPKLADFGMSTLLKEGVLKPRQPVAYTAPEDTKGEEDLTKWSDTFSFGILLLELISGKDPAEKVLDLSGKLSIVEWAQSQVMCGKLDELVDPRLHGAYNREELERVLNTAIMCAQEKPENRLSMREVVEYLTSSPRSANEAMKVTPMQ